MYIYVLSLQCGNYYLGKTLNPEFSFECIDLELKNCAWIRKYAPLCISDFFEASKEEMNLKLLDYHVLKYMNLYGILHVRGGSFSGVVFENHQMLYLKKQVNRFGNGVFCVICGSRLHRDVDCSKSVCKMEGGCEGQSEYDMIENLKANCGRCGRYGHETVHCIAILHQNGTLLVLPGK
jgi:hypothetical protein